MLTALRDEGWISNRDIVFLGTCLAFVLNAVVVWHFEHKEK